MGLADEIRSTNQQITLEVRIGGRVVADVLEVRASHGFDQVNSQATIVCATRPSGADEGATCEAWAGYNGQTALIFRGELSGVAWDYFPAGIALDARSVLWRPTLRWKGGDRTYTAQDDAAVIRNLLEAYGIPNTDANIESSDWELGVIQDVVLKAGDNAMALIAQIDELAGYRTFTISTGVVLRRRISGKAGPSATWAFQKGVDILQVRRIRTLDGIANHVLVKGLTYEDLEVIGEASAPNPYLPQPPGEALLELSSDLVETDAKAEEIAERTVGDRNRRPERLELTTLGNPLIQPGATIQVTHPDVETVGARVFVEHVDHVVSSREFTTTIRTTGGNLSGYEPTAPIAQFALASYLEAEDTGTPPPTRRIILIADGSGSFDPDGQTLTYAWTITPDAGTATPASGTEPVLRSVITGAATSITVTLTVTDADGLTGTASEVLPVAAGQQLVENIWSAEGTIIAVSTDGQQTWNAQTVPNSASATCLCPIAPAWGQLWGCSDGRIYGSFDALSNPPVELGRPHGNVACTAVWAHETDSSRLWAAFADGQVWYGALDVAAKTASWSLRGTVPDSPVNEIRESYGTFGELRATAGANEYYSVDAGASWSVGLAGAGTSPAAWRMAAGFDRNAVAFTAGSPTVAFEAGVTAPTITPAPSNGIRGISFGYRQQELYAADGSNPARLYRSEADFAALAEVGSAAGLTQINHVIRSGNEDGIVYMAGGDGASGGGVIKSLRMEAPWYCRRTGARKVHMIGYGGGGQPVRVVNAMLLLPTSTSQPAADRGLYVYRNGLWSLSTGSGAHQLPLASSTIWAGVTACSFNPLRWMLYGYTPTAALAYLTEDGGATWDAIPIGIPAGTTADGGYSAIMAVFSAKTPGQWLIVGNSRTPFGDPSEVFYWAGHGTTVDTSYHALKTGGARDDILNLVAYRNGDIVGAQLRTSSVTGGTIWRWPPGSATPASVSQDSAQSFWLAAPLEGTHLAGAAYSTGFGPYPNQEQLFISANYATTVPTDTGAAIGQTVAIVGGVAFGAGPPNPSGAAGITQVRRVDDPFAAPAQSTIPATTAPGGETLGLIVSDRQVQSALAVRIGNTINFFVSSDAGASWSLVAGPPSVPITHVLGTHEVVSQ